MPGKIFTNVYRAVKMRTLKKPMTLNVLPQKEGWSIAEKLGIQPHIGGFGYDTLEKPSCSLEDVVLPTLDCQFISIAITICIDAGHFWAQNHNNQTDHILNELEHKLSSAALLPAKTVKVGNIVAALFEENKMYYRCRIESLTETNGSRVANVMHSSFKCI